MKNKYTLGTIEKDNIEIIRKLRNEQIDILRQFKPINSVEQEEYFSKIHKDNKQILFSILDDNTFLGYCGLININYIYGTAEISFIVDGLRLHADDYESIFLFVLNELRKHAFNTLNLNKIWTETYEFRTNHINILESFGMKKDGILREHIYKKGKRYNSIVHSMLRREYESI